MGPGPRRPQGTSRPTGTVVSSTDFGLAVSRPGETQPAELWTRLTLTRGAANYAVTTLNDIARGSKLVRASDPRAAAAQTAPDTPGVATTAVLDGAADGSVSSADFIGDQAARHRLPGLRSARRAARVQRADRPRRSSPPGSTTARAAATACSSARCPRRRSAAARRSSTEPASRARRCTARSTGRGSTSPTRSRRAPTQIKRIPPTGHVMGVYARIETTRGIFKAPAGDEARLLGALDVEYQLSDAEHTDLVEDGQRQRHPRDPGRGDRGRRVADAQHRHPLAATSTSGCSSTTSSRSLKQGLRWVQQEPNRDQLWDAVKYGSVRPFLLGLWRQGAFGSGEPDDVFTIISTRRTTRRRRSTRATSSSRSTSTPPSRRRRS